MPCWPASSAFSAPSSRSSSIPSSGTGAWEAAIVNTLSPGDKVLLAETGQFAVLWRGIAEKFKLDVEFLPTDWRRGADVEAIEARLAADRAHKIKAVLVVHNETSTSCVTHPLEVRKALNRTNHPALLMVDTISGLASLEYEHDAWGIDISVGGSQKGMMLPPGLSFNAVSEKALAASKANTALRSYWDWHDMIAINKQGTFPYTPATNLLFALKEAIAMLEEEGLDNVFTRHKRHGAATRAAAKVWGLDLVCLDPHAYSPALTAVMVPDGHDADAFRKSRAGKLRHVARDRFGQAQGQGVPDRPYRPLQRSDADGNTGRASRWASISPRCRIARGGVLAAMDVLKGRDVVPMREGRGRLS